MDFNPRNQRYHKLRRETEARRRQQVILVLAILAIGIAAVATFIGSSSPNVAEVPAAATDIAAPAETSTPMPLVGGDTPQPAADTPVATTSDDDLPTSVPGATDSLFDAQRFSYEPDFYVSEVQAFLDDQPGPLKDTRFQIGDQSHSFAEVLVSIGSLYSLNPKIILALLEQQSQLLSTAEPSPDQLAWAMDFRGDEGRQQGLFGQLRWGSIELRQGVREYATIPPGDRPEFVFDDDTRQPPPADLSMTQYALTRMLARTTTPDKVSSALNGFLKTYIRLFDDPRQPPTDWPAVAEPFLFRPTAEPARVTSFFDHDTPFLRQNGSLVSFWGQSEIYIPYDGHTGWDYALRPPDPILAAADGTVVFAGNSDDGCFTPARAVVIDHDNGYRTLYWHLSTIAVETGQRVTQGTQLGEAGATGCAFGPHLHFQVQYLGRDVDPYGWCGGTPDPWQNSPAGQVSVWLWADMPSPCGPPPPDVIVVDDGSPGFAHSGEWQQSQLGYAGSALFAETTHSGDAQPWQVRSLDTPAVAIWRPTLPEAGSYRVLAYVPYALNGLDDSNTVRYSVRYLDGQTEIIIDNEVYANSWADLGTYEFDPADPPLVSVSTLAGDEGRGAWADAVAWVPVGR